MIWPKSMLVTAARPIPKAAQAEGPCRVSATTSEHRIEATQSSGRKSTKPPACTPEQSPPFIYRNDAATARAASAVLRFGAIAISASFHSQCGARLRLFPHIPCLVFAIGGTLLTEGRGRFGRGVHAHLGGGENGVPQLQPPRRGERNEPRFSRERAHTGTAPLLARSDGAPGAGGGGGGGEGACWSQILNFNR